MRPLLRLVSLLAIPVGFFGALVVAMHCLVCNGRV